MQECSFDLGEITLTGKRWGTPGKLPVIALHGWLDNSASFDFLAPLLENVDLVALDLAGQGQSGHRQHGGAYNIWLDIMEVLLVAEQLGWQKFALLGHSRGAMISTMIASTYPERITRLALVESFVPQMLPAEEAPKQMAAAINSLMEMRKINKTRTEFDSFEDAVKAREKGLLKLVHKDALVLAERGVIEREGKFLWNNDIKLNAPSEVKFTPEQMRAFINCIRIPVCVVIAEGGLINDFEHIKEFLYKTENVETHHLAGDHHLHMSQQCQSVAGVINAYFSR